MSTAHPVAIAKTARRLYPSHLETFQQCQRRYLFKVVERRAVDEPFSAALTKGTVTHEVLKICGREWMETVSMPADLRALVAARLPRIEYPSDEVWNGDVAEIVEWVKYGSSYLDPYATVLGVERFIDRMYRPEDGSTPIPLGAVADLLLLRTDGNGAKFVEIIDYKTGKNLDASRFAPVISRYALKPLVKSHFPAGSFVPAVYTEIYLAKQHIRSSEMTLERCLAEWEEVKRTLAAIMAESTWEPTPSPLCEWCPFNGNGCAPTHEDDGGLW